MSIFQVEVTDDNQFNEGWLKYLLGLDRPAGEATEDGRSTAAQNGWDMGKDTPTVKLVRQVFTRQNSIDHPQYVVREATGPDPLTLTVDSDGSISQVSGGPLDEPVDTAPAKPAKTKIVVGE
jgi:hypothetical protein